jgi:hypothetical protein
LAAGNSDGITGAKTPPAAPGAVPKQTYIGGSMTLKVGGHRAELTHVTNAHTDGDTWMHGWLLRARRERPRCRRADECDQQFPPSDGDCHTPLPCEVRERNDTTPRACSLHVQGGSMLAASNAVIAASRVAA